VAVESIILVYSMLAGLMSIGLTLLALFFEKDKKRSHAFLVWAAIFIAASFATTEYAFWLEGINLFTFVLGFNFPLLCFFLIWFGFIAWGFESRGERKTWIVLLALLVIVILVAIYCMDCVKF
jgi:hypothetical protein